MEFDTSHQFFLVNFILRHYFFEMNLINYLDNSYPEIEDLEVEQVWNELIMVWHSQGTNVSLITDAIIFTNSWRKKRKVHTVHCHRNQG